MADITLREIQDALEARDPGVVEQIVALAESDLPDEDESGKPFREGALTLQSFLQETRTGVFRKQDKEVQKQQRLQQLASIEADDSEIPCHDRLKAYQILEELWEQDDVYSRTTLLDIIKEIPLVYGPWKAIKKIYKEAESRNDIEMFAAIAVRIDCQIGTSYRTVHFDGPTKETLHYLRRRAWRYLRRIGETFPAIYPDLACEFLSRYPYFSNYDLPNTWIAAHILTHHSAKYSRNRFQHFYVNELYKYRAFPELWQRSPRPLFGLLERAESDVVCQFAIEGLKKDFRGALRDVEAEWVKRLLATKQTEVEKFAIWILENVPKFEQSNFRDLGLHDGVVGLLHSEYEEIVKYAANYVRVHARDLPLEEIVNLENHSNSYISEIGLLIKELVLERDPRKDIGLEAWGKLLSLADPRWVHKALLEHFGPSELTPEWCAKTIKGADDFPVADFVIELLGKLYKPEDLGVGYYCDLVLNNPTSNNVVHFGLNQIEAIGPDQLELDALKWLLLHEEYRYQVFQWIASGKLEPQALTVDFLKALGYHPDWEKEPFIQNLRLDPQYSDITFDEQTSEMALGLLADLRKFSPDEIGFEWLLELVQCSELNYHNFAVDTLIKGFVPADFAGPEEQNPAAEADPGAEIKVDLGGQKFLFTGKLATMTRAEAKKKVTTAGGANAAGVAKSLNYLVIGDEGSPLYDQGRKGSKQLKAESFRDEGADLQIISETAFLQMLTGEVREFSEDAVAQGCERLWQMMTEPKREDDRLANFARKYLLRHHPEICLKETDRPVDPGAEIPASFLTFDQVKPLFSDSRKRLREFALSISNWEFAKWNPPIEGIIDLCEIPYQDVQDFISLALTAEDVPEHKNYRISNEVLTPAAVYRFCESNDAATRALGMLLIERNPRLKLPEELFRLTESPDRNVRAFVLRSFWAIYRDRAETEGWKPTLPPQVSTGKKAKKDAEIAEENLGDGVPVRPADRPASDESLQELLRRILYQVPPGPPPKQLGSESEMSNRLRPLAHRKGKLFLIETIRDLALDEADFAKAVYPLLNEFMHSRGKSEFEACLVAVTRLKHKWGGSLSA